MSGIGAAEAQTGITCYLPGGSDFSRWDEVLLIYQETRHTQVLGSKASGLTSTRCISILQAASQEAVRVFNTEGNQLVQSQ